MADIRDDSAVGRTALDRHLVTREELRAATERQKQLAQQSGSTLPISEVMVDLGFLTRTQASRLVENSEDSGGQPAQQIPGYQLQKKVGAGAMAVVYRAKQLSLDRTVALKILPKRLSRNAEFVERFYREGKAAAALNHNNIVQAIDVGEAGGFHYFVMEFVEGQTVYDELAGGKIYAEKEAIAIVRQIADALGHAHDKGIIHRDVKPKNIMLARGSVAKLADMGLARATTDLEAAMAEAGRAYGTPYYISPEQIRGEVHIDARADLYALGATFYHMVTGRVPYEAPTPSAVMHKHLKQPLTPPDHINTRLTAGCAAVIEMMLAKNRDARYASARDLIEDLDNLARGLPPKHASKAFDHDVFQQLASGTVQPREDHTLAASASDGRVPSSVAVMLGIALAISVVVNILQLVVR